MPSNTKTACERGTFGLVLMDVQMPVMDGYLRKPVRIRELRQALESCRGDSSPSSAAPSHA